MKAAFRTALACSCAALLLGIGAARAEPPDCRDNQTGPFADLCVTETQVRRIVTIDLVVKDEYLEREEVFVDLPNQNVRRSGAIVQVYYNSAFGKAQWSPLTSHAGIYLYPNAISLPVRKWMLAGLDPGRLVRIVILLGE